MKKFKKLNKDKLLEQKKRYMFLIIIMLVGIISGILFIFFIDKTDKNTVFKETNSFFESIKNKEINYLSGFFNSTSANTLSIVMFWLLGISIIGIPIILFLLFFKSFTVGFMISSIIAKYGFKGILLSFAYIFPHHIIYLLIWLLLSYYSVSFSTKLFKVLFLKKNIDLRNHFIKYSKILIITLIAGILCSIIEIYVTPSFIGLFL